MRRVSLAWFLLSVLPALTTPAFAQTTAWGENGFLGFNGVYQISSHTFRDESTPQINQEDAQIEALHEIEAFPGLELSGGGKVYRNLGFGFAGSYMRHRNAATISASLPHPFFFDQPRTVSGAASGLRREELAIHLDALYQVPFSPRVQVTVFGGPSFFRLKQSLVTGVRYSESYPYDEAQFIGIDSADAQSSWTGKRLGYNFGAELTVYFSRWLGVGVTVRRSDGEVELSQPDGAPFKVDVGGTQAGVGLRVRF